MRKLILALSVCALIPLVSVAVAYADDDEDIEFVDDEEEYDTESYDDEDVDSETVDEDVVEEETRVVAKKRMTCDDIKKAMDELSANLDIGEVEQAKLESLKNDYRSKCSKRTSGGRRGVGRSKAKATVSAVRAVNNAKANQAAAAGCDTPDANGCCPGETYTDLGDAGFGCCAANSETCFPPMQVPSAPSLCDDGSKPDKNGCCKGETYTDLGAQGFNCCLSDKVTCFPPLVVK